MSVQDVLFEGGWRRRSPGGLPRRSSGVTRSGRCGDGGERLEKHGYGGPGGSEKKASPSGKRIPLAQVEEVLRLYKENVLRPDYPPLP